MGGCQSKKEEAKKLKACCACPETKKARDECITQNGEAKCGYLIEAHKKCLRDHGFEMVLGKDELLQLQVRQKEVIKIDAAIKRQIEELRFVVLNFSSHFRLLRALEEPTTKEVAGRSREIKKTLGKLEGQISELEKFSSKVRVATLGEKQELYDQIKEHRNEAERNKKTFRQTLVYLKNIMDEQDRSFLFKSGTSREEEIELRNRMKRLENIKKDAFQATESLSNLVSKMSDQVKLSEETTSNLLHSSSVLKGTESEFDSMRAHITSGGKLISKYGRRENTDRILLGIALIVYFAVILKKMASKLELRSELVELLRTNKAEEAKRLLQRDESLTFSKDDSGRTAIHWAAAGGCLEIVEFCVSLREESAASEDDIGWTPIMIACSAGRLEVVKYLVKLPYVNVNSANCNGQTALHYASSRNHPQITSILLKNGANVNAQDKFRATPLHRAASQGHEKVVSVLLSAPGIQIDLTDSSGCSALLAIWELEKCEETNFRHLAVEEGREDIAILLVKKGADLYMENKEKKTPISLAGNGELRKKLVGAGNWVSSG
ncbi:unnamed protein product [Enterobius vermicularis]|uniref:ANK_REP_REGION domain-containing protein n=1 Tax=Enterobius vermicularis TaxID=51028 RepID=A0A0N4VFP4_ENTVE|nr:unnamed protein product [Enterobius vermicularis]